MKYTNYAAVAILLAFAVRASADIPSTVASFIESSLNMDQDSVKATELLAKAKEIDISIALNTTKDDIVFANNALKAAEKDLGDAENNLATEENDLAAAEKYLEAAAEEITSTANSLADAEKNVNSIINAIEVEEKDFTITDVLTAAEKDSEALNINFAAAKKNFDLICIKLEETKAEIANDGKNRTGLNIAEPKLVDVLALLKDNVTIFYEAAANFDDNKVKIIAAQAAKNAKEKQISDHKLALETKKKEITSVAAVLTDMKKKISAIRLILEARKKVPNAKNIPVTNNSCESSLFKFSVTVLGGGAYFFITRRKTKKLIVE